MTYFPVENPYNIFTETDGTPLENGYIYIGEANLNPITNPITVYWDSAGLYPAAQPIRTVNGYPSRAGSIGKIFTNTSLNNTYSILVKDRHLRTVYFVRDAATDLIGNLFYSEVTNVKQYGAVGDGVADDTAAVNAALSASDKIRFPAGIYNINGMTIPADNKTIIGDGYQNTVLNVTTTAPNYGIDMGGYNYTSFIDIKIQGDDGTKYLIDDGGNCYYTRFTRVTFFRCEYALNISTDFYWSTFTDCIFRDCDIGIYSPGAQDFNAITFTACTFWHSSPATSGDALDITDADGIVFNGCHAQNQGIKLTNCQGVQINGGYWECYSRAAIKALTNTAITMSGVIMPTGNRISFDESSAARLDGIVPDHIVSKSGTAVEIINYGDAKSTVKHSIDNYFPDPYCTTTTAVDSFNYTVTGINMARSINGSSNLQCDWTATNQQVGFRFDGTRGICVLVLFRVTAGECKIQLYNTTLAHIRQINSATDPDWQYYRASSTMNTGLGPRLLISPVSTTGTIEIDTVVVCPTTGYIPNTTDLSDLRYFPAAKIDALTSPSITATDIVSNTISIGGKSILTRLIGNVVSVTGGGSAVGYTFTTADYGFYYVVIDRGAFASTALHYWQGYVFVGSNNLIVTTTINNLYFGVSVSGLVLSITNSASTADGRVVAIKLADA